MRKTEVGRLVIRYEGEFWNAYYAQHTTSMTDAVLLGSIRINLIANDLKIKQSFMELMQATVAQCVREITGLTPTWGEPQERGLR